MFYPSSVVAFTGLKATSGVQKKNKTNLCGTPFLLAPIHTYSDWQRTADLFPKDIMCFALSHYISMPSNQISTPFKSQSVGRSPIHFSKSKALPFKAC